MGRQPGIAADRIKTCLDEDGSKKGDQKRVLATPEWFSGVWAEVMMPNLVESSWFRRKKIRGCQIGSSNGNVNSKTSRLG